MPARPRLAFALVALAVSAAPARAQAQAEDGGVGIALKFENEWSEYPRIFELLPGGAAAKDGRLKEGDRIVGVVDDAGERLDLKGQPLGEFVRHIRGPVGSKVMLLVLPLAEHETRTFELTRQALELPPSP